MRVNDGQPLHALTGQATPALAVSLIAMDVDMIWGKPYFPQLSSRVDKMQDTIAHWVEIHKAAGLTHLQRQLDLWPLPMSLTPRLLPARKKRLVAFS